LIKAAEAIEWGQKRRIEDPNKAIGKDSRSFWKAPAMPANASSAAFLKF
jgi:carbon-monoxide dehydrogenase large subunit